MKLKSNYSLVRERLQLMLLLLKIANELLELLNMAFNYKHEAWNNTPNGRINLNSPPDHGYLCHPMNQLSSAMI